MRKFFGLSKNHVCQEECVLTLGMFDGLHQGHQYLLQKAREKASMCNGLLVVFTFSDLPKTEHNLIFSSYHKNVLMEKMGVDILVEIPFSNEMKNLQPSEFLDKVTAMFPFSSWVVGEDFHFGANRLGDGAFLKAYVKGSVEVVEPFFREEFSSTNVRKYIIEGHLSKVSFLLGRTYTIMTKARVTNAAREPRTDIEYDPFENIQFLDISSTKTTLTIDAKNLCLPMAPMWRALVRLGGEYQDIPATCVISAHKECCLTLPEKIALPDLLFPEVILLSKIEP